MKYYCPHCGNELALLRLFAKHYASLLRCPQQPQWCFLELSDAHNHYPLLSLELGVADSLLKSEDKIIDMAFSRIKYIDYKTVSIVFFEQTLLGIYRDKED